MTPSRLAVGLAALAFVWLGCDSLPGKPTEAERYRRPSEILDFESLYAVNCAGCHGSEGTLGPARPLADSLYLELIGRERMGRVIAEGVPGTAMPTFLDANGGTLTQAQIDAVRDGLFENWWKPPTKAAARKQLPGYAQPAAARAARGGDAFSKYCADCHGADGLGPEAPGERKANGKKGGAVLDPNFLALVSDQMLRTAVIAGRTDLGMPDWRATSDGGPMTEPEINDVVAWMSERRP